MSNARRLSRGFAESVACLYVYLFTLIYVLIMCQLSSDWPSAFAFFLQPKITCAHFFEALRWPQYGLHFFSSVYLQPNTGCIIACTKKKKKKGDSAMIMNSNPTGYIATKLPLCQSHLQIGNVLILYIMDIIYIS